MAQALPNCRAIVLMSGFSALSQISEDKIPCLQKSHTRADISLRRWQNKSMMKSWKYEKHWKLPSTVAP